MQVTKKNPRFRLGYRDTLRIVWPYVKRKFNAQLEGIWFIVVYLAAFQIFVLKLPIVYGVMIAAGIFIVTVGLSFFMEGLRLGLMPLGEHIGRVLPRNSKIPVILLFAFLLGVGATLAEPAISVLKAAGSGVSPKDAPLLYSLLNDHAGQLVASVGVGVGLAVALGIFRFFLGWHLKAFAICCVSILLFMSIGFSLFAPLADVLGLAWDCGAVTTGPVTVPLVLALGIGVCRVVGGKGGGGGSGFGIVTLASLFPIFAVLCLSLYHYLAGSYYGMPGYEGPLSSQAQVAQEMTSEKVYRGITQEEFVAFQNTSQIKENYKLELSAENSRLVDGKIVIDKPQITLRKESDRRLHFISSQSWDRSQSIRDLILSAAKESLRATIPLCLFLLIVLKVYLKQKLTQGADVVIGIFFAFVGMALFSLGIALGLTPLGGQLGGNVPLTFADIKPWGTSFYEYSLFSPYMGKVVAIFFAFFLGYGATLAEPALNALGETVEKVTAGAFKKSLLMHSVAIGVGLGISAGVVKMIFNLPLVWMLVPAYSLCLVLTYFSPHTFVNFGWDSAGVTTGPITVPLVLAMGLGVGANIPEVKEGFGILAMASVGPILTVLAVGLYTHEAQKEARSEPVAMDDSSDTKKAA